MMIRGDLVHIPQDSFLLELSEDGLKSYVKVDKPIKALYWDDDPSEPRWGTIFYKEKIWNIRKKDIYPIIQEMENAS
jgi:hypothetical protein